MVMKRREFLKSTLLMAAVSTVVGKAAGLFNTAIAAPVFMAAGKLGYKEVSPQAKAGKQCSTCKHFKENEEASKAAGKKGPAGVCTLAAVKGAMKTKEDVYVLNAAYCNMWAKKA
jgi:hypothetical protein